MVHPMPRPPSHPLHVLQTVRDRLDLTQEQLAKAVGVKTVTIRKIESGKLKPGKDLAFRIMCETELDPDQLMENFEPEKPRRVMRCDPDKLTSDPDEVTKESYQAFKNLPGPDDKRVEEQIELWSRDIRQMSKAVAQRGKFDVFRVALSRALGELCKDFDLPPLVKIIPPVSERLRAQSARKPPLQPVSPGCGNGEKRSVNRSHDPSARQFRQHA
jgi:DNA-binding XRE family transcriptional regulator